MTWNFLGRVCTPYLLHFRRAEIVKRLGSSESQEIDSSVLIRLFGNWGFRTLPKFKGAPSCWKLMSESSSPAVEKHNFLDFPSKHYSSFLFMKRSRPISRVLVSESHTFALGMSGVHRFLQNCMSDIKILGARTVIWSDFDIAETLYISSLRGTWHGSCVPLQYVMFWAYAEWTVANIWQLCMFTHSECYTPGMAFRQCYVCQLLIFCFHTR